MDDEAKHAELEAIRQRRLEGRRHRSRLDIATRLFLQKGAVEPGEVEAALERDWTPPTDQQLADEVASKCLAAVEHQQQRAQAAQDAVGALEAKRSRFEQRLAEVKEQLKAAREIAKAEQSQLPDLVEVYQASLAAGGVPNRSPRGEVVQAKAQVAAAAAAAGKES